MLLANLNRYQNCYHSHLWMALNSKVSYNLLRGDMRRACRQMPAHLGQCDRSHRDTKVESRWMLERFLSDCWVHSDLAAVEGWTAFCFCVFWRCCWFLDLSFESKYVVGVITFGFNVLLFCQLLASDLKYLFVSYILVDPNFNK